jgi:hypothetical protein
MLKLHDFLVEHAKFPFPLPSEDCSVGTTDISALEVGLLKPEWKASHAVRDDNLVQKLCRTLEKILGDTTLTEDSAQHLLARFDPRIQFQADGVEQREWRRNPSEMHVKSFAES